MKKLEMGDGTTKNFVNSNAECGKIKPEMRAFFDYINKGIATDKLTETLDTEVLKVRNIIMNELLLILSLLLEFTFVVLAYKFFGKIGLFAWISLATVLANVEVLILVKAFGIEMTLGNVLFASTFLATDILSEKFDKKTAKQGVLFGIIASVVFLFISASWLMYKPSVNDGNFELFYDIFTKTPRIIIASVVVYAISELLDVYLYHKVWEVTSKAGDRKRGLWLRNNVATIVSQIVNAVLYNLLAFGGVYHANTMVSIIVANILIYIATSFADTPFLYLACSLENSKKK